MTQVIATGQNIELGSNPARPRDQLWMTANQLHSVTGWELKAEGLCRGDTCVPISSGDLEKFVEGDELNASGLWQTLDRPVLHDDAHTTWVLGEGAVERSRQLESLIAPDFRLPDIDGNLHSLSDHRGKKVLLVSWASW